MKAAKLILIAAVLAVALPHLATAQNSIVVESRTLVPSQPACTVGVFISNSVPISGMVFQLESRTVSGGAYFVGPISGVSWFHIRPGSRVDNSPLGVADPGGQWPAASRTTRRMTTPSANVCSGPISHTWNTASANVGTSPDAIEHATVSTGDPEFDEISLPVGADPATRDSASFIFIFDANASPGCFEIDSCCVAPANHVIYIDGSGNPIIPAFTKGTICIEGEIGNQPPVIDCPEFVSEPVLFSDSGRTVNYTVSYSDEDSTLVPVCTPPSGAFFYQGNTDVTCIVTDTFGLADTCVFPVIVYDTGAPNPNTPPVLSCAAQHYITVEPGETGATVTFNISFSDEDPTLVPVSTPPSGSFFPLGITAVTTVVTDTFGLADTCTFPIWVGVGADQSSVVVESKTFTPGETGCEVGVFISNHIPIPGLVLPLELRSISGGAYFVTPVGSSVFKVQPGSRLDASPLGTADPGGLWPAASSTRRLFSTTVTSVPNCSSTDDANAGWNTSSGTLDGSPDAVSYATVAAGDPNDGDMIALPPGSDPPSTADASLIFTFDADTLEGCFVIDTTCIRPAGHITYVDLNTQPITPSFTKGTICISSCICECHGNPANCANPSIDVLDVIYVLNVVFRGQTAIGDNNPACPVYTTDLNCDDVSDIIDAVRIINVAFRGANAATEFCDPCP